MIPESVRWLCAFMVGLLLLVAGGAGCDVLPEDDERAGTAEVVWSFDYTKDFQIGPTAPVIADGSAYVVAAGMLYGLDLETGERQWTTDLGVNKLISSALVHDNKLLFAQHGGHWVRAYQKGSGILAWQADLERLPGADPQQMAQSKTHLFVGGKDEVLRIKKTTGEVDLRIAIRVLVPDSVSQRARELCASDDGGLFVPTDYPYPPYLYDEPTAGNALAFEEGTGVLRWAHHISVRYYWEPQANDSLALQTQGEGCDVGGDVVVFSTDTRLIAYDRASGDVRWARTFQEDGFDARPTVSGGVVYIHSVRGRVYALDLDTGETLWRQETNGSASTTIAVEGSHVYFCNNAWNELWILDARTGEALWHSRPPGYGKIPNVGYLSSPAVGERHLVVVGSRKVYGLKLH